MSIQDNPAGQHRPALSVVSALLLAVSAVWCTYWFVHAWNYWEDDAYIHLEFARSVVAGRGFAFNGRVVAGDTAPLWVFLLAGMHGLIPDWLVAGKVLTAFGAAFGLTGAYVYSHKLAATLIPSIPGAAIFPAAMVLLIVANPYSCYWLFSGMEPFAAAGVAFFAALAATRRLPSTGAFLTGCMLAGIAPLLRPEMVFLTALLAVALLGQWYRLPSTPAKPASFAAGLLLIAGPLTLWSIYSLHAFGHLLPNTNAAKRADPAQSVVLHLLSIFSFGFPAIVCGLLAGIAYLLLRASAVRRSLQSAIASAFARPAQSATNGTVSLPLSGWLFILWPAISTIFYIANHTYVQTRYILVTAPGLTIVIMAVAIRAFRRTGRVLYLLALASAFVVSIAIGRPFVRNKGINCQLNRDMALFIRDHTPPDAPVADYSIGEIAFDSEHPIIDTGGITRPGAIPYLYSPPEAMARWARAEGAQYDIVAKQPEPGAVAVYSQNQAFVGWTLNPAFYSTTYPVSLWKFAPVSAPPEQAEGSLASHP